MKNNIDSSCVSCGFEFSLNQNNVHSCKEELDKKIDSSIKSWVFKRTEGTPSSGNVLARCFKEAKELINFRFGEEGMTEAYCAETNEKKVF